MKCHAIGQQVESWRHAVRRYAAGGSSGLMLALTLLALILIAGCEKAGQPGPASHSTPPPQPALAPKTITTPNGLTMVLLPAGEFLMGDNQGDEDEKPAHKVQVSAFHMDTHEVSQKAYQDLVERNPSKFPAPDKPVEQVDWYHAILYCNLRSLREGLRPCYDTKTLSCDFSADGYRLPTEAEWEYACRAGTASKFTCGDDAAKLRTFAWYKAGANETTHAVGQKSPNPWGLYDLHGNVAEWCQDIYGEHYYAESPKADPRGPASGAKRVLRGGSWRTSDDACRSSARNSESPRFADACFGSDSYGFRCVRRAP